jgi:hypothetical protein
MKKRLKPFNLKEALQGNVEVETTSGRKVKYIHLIENCVTNFPVIVVLESENEGGTDEILNYTVKGTFWNDSNTSKFDLQMYDKVAVCYMNVYMSKDKKFHLGGGHKIKQDAIENICAPINYKYLKTIEITEQTTEDVSNDDDTYSELGLNDINILMNIVGNMFGGNSKLK